MLLGQARYIQYKLANRQKLVALKHTLPKRAAYDDNEAAKLHDTAKYTAVADLLWQFINPAERQSSSLAGKALLYAKKAQHSWLNDHSQKTIMLALLPGQA